MAKVIDYYLSLQSPWAYMGHARLVELAARQKATINAWPVDYGKIFPATGGLPLPKRAPERRAYRMAELRRWRDFLSITLNLEPKHFPVNDLMAARVVIAQRKRDPDAALALVGAILRAVWAEERDISNPDTIAEIVSASGGDGAALVAEAEQDSCAETLDRDSQAAIAAGVFGAPSYVYRDELFWGQDRLEFLERALAE